MVGGGLTVAGVLLQVWFQPISWAAVEPGPLAGLTRIVLQVAPRLGLLCATTGAVMLALAVFIRLTDQRVVTGAVPRLLWVGLAMGVLVMCLDYVTLTDGFYETAQDVPVRLLMGVYAAIGVLQVVAGAIIAFGVTGLLARPPAASASADNEPPLAPSRPF